MASVTALSERRLAGFASVLAGDAIVADTDAVTASLTGATRTEG